MIITDFRDLRPEEHRTTVFTHYDSKTDVPRDAFLDWLKKANSRLNQTQLMREFYHTAQLVEAESQADMRLTSVYTDYIQSAVLHQEGKDKGYANPDITSSNPDMFKRRYDSLTSHTSPICIIEHVWNYVTKQEHSPEHKKTIFFQNNLKIVESVKNSVFSGIDVKNIDDWVPTC